MRSSRYDKAIGRNLAELQGAILNRTTMTGIENAGDVTSLFLELCYYALFNDYIAHCIKVFEQGKQAASFWYIYRTDQSLVDKIAKRQGISIATFEEVSGKLKKIRDETHFHIDTAGVLDTKSVWRDANLTGKELSTAVDAAWEILSCLQQSLSLPEVTLPTSYKPKHVKAIAAAINSDNF